MRGYEAGTPKGDALGDAYKAEVLNKKKTGGESKVVKMVKEIRGGTPADEGKPEWLVTGAGQYEEFDPNKEENKSKAA